LVKEISRLLYEYEVKDKNGKIIKKGKGRSHSWLKIMLWILKAYFATRYHSLTGSANEDIPDETGVTHPFPKHDNVAPPSFDMSLSALGADSDTTQGIVVGNDDTPNTPDQYGLNSKIEHGNGAGQLIYGAMTVESLTSPSDGTWQFRAIRAFTNNSGADVIVKEIGFLVKIKDKNETPASFCLIRDVLSTPITVPDGASFTWRYIFQVVVS